MTRTPVWGGVLPLIFFACATTTLTRGAPIGDPTALATSASASSGAAGPVRVVFEWEYGDDRGNLRGDGAARINPPDRFRLDMISTAEASLSAALVDGDLSVSGQIEDVELPPSVFLYAMTGLFRPGAGNPTEGFESEGFDVLGYPVEDGGVRYFFFMGDRLERVEERVDGRLTRRIGLEWGADPTWPREARYRDDLTPSVVRWELVRVVPNEGPWAEEIYDVDPIR